MPERSHGERITRLEDIAQVLAEGQLSAEKAIADLASATRLAFDQIAEQFRESRRRLDETDERMRRTDERLEKLIIAMGEFIRRN